ncbi:GDP-mannose 4,6-dehydratase, partial [candidate division CSSED10-310 bacterium]
MKILITGISGFAGSHLTEYLLSFQKHIFGLVRPDEDLSNLS